MGIRKPKAILDNIRKFNNNQANVIKLVVPLTKDLNNFLATLRKAAGGNTELYLGELAQWCLDHITIPDDHLVQTVSNVSFNSASNYNDSYLFQPIEEIIEEEDEVDIVPIIEKVIEPVINKTSQKRGRPPLLPATKALRLADAAATKLNKKCAKKSKMQ